MTQKMIRKRDGRLVEFHTEKIRNAIWRSFLGVGQTGMEDVSDALARKVETMLELEGCEPEVEHVQDLVEQVLMQEGYGRTAKAYILYREERSRARQVNSSLMRKFEEITFKDAADSDIKRENANIDGDTAMGTMLRYGSEAAKQFSESFLMKPEYATAHERGDDNVLPDRPALAVPRRLFHRPRPHPRTAEHRVVCVAGLHRHPVEPERPARRPEHREL